MSIAATIAEWVDYAARVRVWLTTTLGRIYLAMTALVLGILALNHLVVRDIEDPSLAVSLLSNSEWPLLTISLALATAARGQWIRRDRVALAVAMTSAVTLSAAGVAVDQHVDAADPLLAATGPLLGLTIVAVLWSALGRRPHQATT